MNLNKKNLMIFLVIFPLLLNACSGNKINIDEKLIENTKSDEPKIIDQTMERFAEFHADVRCQISEASLGEDLNNIIVAINDTIRKGEKYGFSEEDIEPLNKKYENNAEFIKLAEAKMNEMCPETIEALEQKN